MQMVGPMMESMVVYAPSVGLDTLHDYHVSLIGAELESMLRGATQMFGRPLYLSFWFCSTIYPPYISSNKRV
jgi:hypothetical protein